MKPGLILNICLKFPVKLKSSFWDFESRLVAVKQKSDTSMNYRFTKIYIKGAEVVILSDPSIKKKWLIYNGTLKPFIWSIVWKKGVKFW